ncbi:hypothetical protein MVEG_08729 [Podila verticillata NRRL 6337]|nr:hypothetical protein MVEG_08729 [Podila verticillata NRRL 6337]
MLRTQFFKDIATSADLRAADLEGSLLAVETIFAVESRQPAVINEILGQPFTQLTVKVPEKGKVKVQISFHDKKGKVKCLILYNVEVSPLEQCVLFTTAVNSIRWITETICFATNFRFFENSV